MRPRLVKLATAGPAWFAVTLTVPRRVPFLLYPVKVATTLSAQAAVTRSVVTVNSNPGRAVIEMVCAPFVNKALGWLVTPLV